MFAKRLDRDSLMVGTPAKVNLFLEVLNRREDGYHNINSLFQAVSLFDRIKFIRKTEPGINLTVENCPDLPTDENNLVVKACRLMQKEFGFDSGMEINLQKNIPVAAGLGGGSADGAAAILACNILFDLDLNLKEMALLGLQIGSDIPFFFSGGQALVTGRGEIITETEFPTDYWLVLITPNIAVSTAESYAALKIGLTMAKNPINLKPCRNVIEFVESLKTSVNNFEEAHLLSYPELAGIKDDLLKRNALLVRMSGSGATMFGIFKEVAEEWTNNRIFKQGDWQINVVRPITLPLKNMGKGGSGGDY